MPRVQVKRPPGTVPLDAAEGDSPIFVGRKQGQSPGCSCAQFKGALQSRDLPSLAITAADEAVRLGRLATRNFSASHSIFCPGNREESTPKITVSVSGPAKSKPAEALSSPMQASVHCRQ